MNAVGQKLGGMGVPEVVKPHLGEASEPVRKVPELARQRPWMLGLAVLSNQPYVASAHRGLPTQRRPRCAQEPGHPAL